MWGAAGLAASPEPTQHKHPIALFYKPGIRSSGKLMKSIDHAQGWQGRRRRVSGRALALRARLALAGPRPFCRDGRRDFVYSCLVDSARGRDLRVVDSAELVVAMRESP